MSVKDVTLGDNAPKEFNVVIEIPSHGSPVKYELDKDTGALIVDRVISTSMVYPCNYGFLPQTLGQDGDPLDALVITEYALLPGSVIKCRSVGVIVMEDEKGMDEKIICVPISKVSKYFDNIITYKDLPEIKIQQIVHFFEHYKDLEPGKWVKMQNVEGVDKAENLIKESIKNYKP